MQAYNPPIKSIGVLIMKFPKYPINYLNTIIAIVSLLPLLCLTRCSGLNTSAYSQLREKFSPKHLNTFLGKSAQVLIKEFGQPQQKDVKGNKTALTFYYAMTFRNVPVMTGYAQYQGWSPNAYGPGKGGYIGGSYGQNQYNMYSYVTFHETCYITFILVDNVAVHWNRQGSAKWCGNLNGQGIL